MPYEGKPLRFIQAVAHGMKPRNSDLSQEEAKKMLRHNRLRAKAQADAVKGGK